MELERNGKQDTQLEDSSVDKCCEVGEDGYPCTKGDPPVWNVYFRKEFTDRYNSVYGEPELYCNDHLVDVLDGRYVGGGPHYSDVEKIEKIGIKKSEQL